VVFHLAYPAADRIHHRHPGIGSLFQRPPPMALDILPAYGCIAMIAQIQSPMDPFGGDGQL
jgi:hypothetical protein